MRHLDRAARARSSWSARRTRPTCARPRRLLRDGVVDLVRSQRGERGQRRPVLDWISVGHADGSGDRLLDARPDRRHEGLPARRPVRDRAGPDRARRGGAGRARLPEPAQSRRHRRGAIFVAIRGRAARCTIATSDLPVPAVVAAPGCARRGARSASRSSRATRTRISRRGSPTARASPPSRTASTASASTRAVARGDASIYLRLPTRADYGEKIWDHAAGKFVVEQAGGRGHRRRRRAARLLARSHGSSTTAVSSPPMAGSTTRSSTPCNRVLG